MSWQALVDAVSELAAFGAERLHDQVAYLATLKADGSPRLHPVRPVVASGRLFVFMETTSPKVRDLEHDGRYALHGTANKRPALGPARVRGRRYSPPHRRSWPAGDGQRRQRLPAR
jgi:hypothetical protein